MGKIHVHNIRAYAFHGCMEEESKIGTDYRIDLSVDTDLSLSAATDELKHTVDYVALTEITLAEMRNRAKLIEVVLYRICDRIFREHVSVKKVEIEIAKNNPPINANVGSVAVSLSIKRKNWEPQDNH